MHETGVEPRSVAQAERRNTEGMLLVVGQEENKLVLITVAHVDLMAAVASIDANEEEFAGRITEVVNCILTMRDRVFKVKERVTLLSLQQDTHMRQMKSSTLVTSSW